MTLNSAQEAQLLRGINPKRVKILDGMSHLEAWDVRAMLIRVFGFGGWSGEVTDVTLIHDQETTTRAGKEARKVAYRVTYQLTIQDTMTVYTETAVGESTMPSFKHGDAHDMAIKTGASQAMKRCAVNLGDQFGLGLYNNGNTAAVVRSLVTPETANDPHEYPVESAEPGSDPNEEVVIAEPLAIEPEPVDEAEALLTEALDAQEVVTDNQEAQADDYDAAIASLRTIATISADAVRIKAIIEWKRTHSGFLTYDGPTAGETVGKLVERITAGEFAK